MTDACAFDLTWQVLGHAKTVLVLLGGWLLFKESINSKQLAGELASTKHIRIV